MTHPAAPQLTGGPASAAQETAARLRREILDRNEPGWFLGTEEDLLARLGVSRPTLRQAARILEQEQLLDVRRGVHGGLYGRVPTGQAVVHVASVYLESQGADLRHLAQAGAAISPAIARLAAVDGPVAERAALAAWVVAAQSTDRGRDEILATAVEFGRRVARLSGNPPLALLESVVLELSLWSAELDVFDPPPRVAVLRRHHVELATAIRDGDADRAFELSRRFTEQALAWVEQAGAR